MLARDAEEGIGAFIDKRDRRMDGRIDGAARSPSSRWASSDLDRAVALLRGDGADAARRITDGVAFFQMGGSILALWPRAELARGCRGRRTTRRPGSAAPRSPTTRARMRRSTRCWPPPSRPAAASSSRRSRAFWGGWYGYFADAEGHLWEVAHNPAFPIDADGRISLPRMNHDRYDDAYIAGILNTVHTIAIVGASPNDVRPSFFVLKYLLGKGFCRLPGQSRPWPARSSSAARSMPGLPTFPSRSTWSTSSATSDAAPGIVDEALAAQAAAEGHLDAARRAQ